jgi:hypothetical protein
LTAFFERLAGSGDNAGLAGVLSIFHDRQDADDPFARRRLVSDAAADRAPAKRPARCRKGFRAKTVGLIA